MLTSFLSFGLLSGPSRWQLVLVFCAVFGTVGMVWAVVGYSRKAALYVLILLVLGTLAAMAGALNFVALRVMEFRMSPGGPPPLPIWQILLGSWVFCGPPVVGIYLIWKNVGKGREVA
jgi:hypothetical protein